ncbi:MAG TPA: hypothetical protein VGO62_14085 [Myxococcota bacterium]|jgi:hypothetical protein
MKKLPLAPLRLLPFLAALPIASCTCSPVVGAIAPQIYTDACKEPQRVVSNKNIGGFEKCGIDIGASDITVKVTKTITITNPSIVALNLIDVSVVGDPSFTLVHTDDDGKTIGLGSGDVIGVGLSGDIVIEVRPEVATTLSTNLYIKSDAKNPPQSGDGTSLLTIPITVQGVDNGVPKIQVTPLDCDFDKVAVKGVKVCPVQISNIGNRDLILDSVDFVSPGADTDPVFDVPPGSTTTTPFAFAGRPPGPEEPIKVTDPSASPPVLPITLSVQFRPDVEGHYTSKILIKSNDPDTGLAGIPITLEGVGVLPPTCAVTIKSINGAAPSGDHPAIQPLDDVVLSLETSQPSTPGGQVVGYAWQSPPEGPPTSHAILSTPGQVDTGFTFDGTKVGVDFAGTYTVRAQVTDDLGVASVNDCSITFQAIPQQNFHVELSWDTSTNDFDLHITKKTDDGKYCIEDTSTSGDGPAGEVGGLLSTDCTSSLDCNFATCRVGDSQSPDWDGDGVNQSSGDPTLDVDDIDGFGPENQNVDTMVPGDYLVGVNEYDGTSQTGATAQVQIFIYGRLAASFFQDMSVGDYWEVALIHWPTDPSDPVCIEDLTDGDAHDDCG